MAAREPGLFERFVISRQRRRDSSLRNIHVAAAASPRLVSTEYPRSGPRPRRDPPPRATAAENRYPAGITFESLFLVTGNPVPSHIDAVFASFLNDSFADARKLYHETCTAAERNSEKTKPRRS